MITGWKTWPCIIQISDIESKQVAFTQSMSKLSKWHKCKTPYARYEQHNPTKLEHTPRGEIGLVICLWILLWGATYNHQDICFNRYHCLLWGPCFHSWFLHHQFKWLMHRKSSWIYKHCRQMQWEIKKRTAWYNSHIWAWLNNMAFHNSHI